MIKLLQINSVVNTGSTGRIVEEIGQVAIANGWKSYIAYGRNARESQSELIRIGNNLDTKLHGLKTRLFDKHGFGSAAASKIFIIKVKNINPDIIHLHNIHGYYLNVEILFDYLKQSGKQVIWTFHDCWPFTGHCAHFSLIDCNKWTTKCNHCPQKTSYPISFVFDRSTSNFLRKKQLFTTLKNLTIVPVSSWLGELVEQSFFSKTPIKVINNGVDTKIFELRKESEQIRNKYGIANRHILLGVATSWSKSKGIDDFYHLSTLLPSDYVIALVGLTPKLIRTLPKNIIGIPRTESLGELVQLYSAADIVISLSSQETFGLTIVEGFSCGTPGIVYDCTASPELISSNTGIIVEKGNFDELISAIYEITEKGKSYYSKDCRERAIEFYNKWDRYNEYFTLYQKLLSI